MSIIKEIYIAKKQKDSDGNDILDSNGKTLYCKPKLYKFNVQPINGESDIKMYGSSSKGVQVAVINYREYFGQFGEDDKAYLDGVLPKNERVNGIKANYRISAVLNQNIKIRVFFEKLPTK